MKKNSFLLSLLLVSIASNSQIGVGTKTPNPSALVDFNSSDKGILFPKIALTNISDITTIPNPEIGLTVFNTANSGTAPNNVLANTYYVYNGSRWEMLKNGIYSGSGSLSGSTIVEQGANTLGFNSTAVNAFSVDGSTFSVNASNNRVGIGTIAPLADLQVLGSEIKLGGASNQAGSISNPILRIHSNANEDNKGGSIEFNEDNAAFGYYIKHNTSSGPILGQDGLSIGVKNPYEPSKPGFFLASDKRVGIGTTSPQTRFHIDGGSDNPINTAPLPADITDDIVVNPLGNMGLGTLNPTEKLDVIGKTRTTNLQVTTGAAVGKVLTSDATGNATWEDAPSGGTTYQGSTSIKLNGTSFETEAFTGDVTTLANSTSTTISNDAITSAKIADGSIGTTDLADNSITSDKIADGSIGTTDLANNSVTVDKLPLGATATTFLRGDGTWVTPPNTIDGNGIYSGSGSLSGSTIVEQGANPLGFNSTAVNAFSVDGSTFSVNASNNRVGIGTIAPLADLQVLGSEIKLGGASNQAGSISNPILRIHSNANEDNKGGSIEFNEDNAAFGYYIKHNTSSGPILGQDGLSIGVKNPYEPSKPGFFLASDKRVGIGTTSPQTRFHIDGGSDNPINTAPLPADITDDIVVNPLGNMGLGTLNPTEKLDVIGKTRTTNLQVTAGAAAGRVLTSDATGNATWGVAPAGASDGNGIYSGSGSLSSPTIVTQGSNTLAFTSNAGANAFSVDGSTLSINAASNAVGISNNNPQANLHVSGSVRLDNLNTVSNSLPSLVVDNLGNISKSSINTSLFYSYKYVISNVDKDYISNFNTNISSTNYNLTIVGSSFNRSVALYNSGVPAYRCYADVEGGTWRIRADYLNSSTTDNSNGTWEIYVLVMDNTQVRSLGDVNVNLSGSSAGSGSKPIQIP